MGMGHSGGIEGFVYQIINFSKQPEISSVFAEKQQKGKTQSLLFFSPPRCAGKGSFPLWEEIQEVLKTLGKEKPWS